MASMHLSSYKINALRQHGQVVRDLKSGDPEFKSHPDHQLVLFQVVPGSTPRLCLYISQLVCLRPVEILNLFGLFQWFISLALKSPNGEGSIIKLCIHTYINIKELQTFGEHLLPE